MDFHIFTVLNVRLFVCLYCTVGKRSDVVTSVSALARTITPHTAVKRFCFAFVVIFCLSAGFLSLTQ